MFKIAKEVSIFSNSYAFKFDVSQPLGMIAPIWVPEDEQATVVGSFNEGGRGSTFILKLLESVNPSRLSVDMLFPDATLLLFLRKLRCIKIQIDGANSQDVRKDFEDGKTSLRSGNTTQHYHVVKHTVDAYTGEYKRPNVSKSDVVLAFPLQGDGEPLVAKQKVHAFLPLRSYGFSVRSSRCAVRSIGVDIQDVSSS